MSVDISASDEDIKLTDKYQVMPSLGEEEYNALKADIAENGVQDPIHIDGGGNVIDGHHRLKVCEELEIPQSDIPIKRHSGKSDEEKRSMAWRLNMQRRHLDHGQKKELVKQRLDQLIEAGIDRTDEEIADELGVSRQHVSDIRKRHVSEVLDETRSCKNATNGNFTTERAEKVSDYATGEQKRQFIKEVLVENPERSNNSVAETVDSTHPTVGSVREDMAEVYNPQLFNKDCRDMLEGLSSDSVDCVIADPPYGIQFSGNRYDTASADELEGDDSHEVIEGIADGFYDILKDNRHAYVFCRYDTYPAFVEEFAGPFELDTVIVWDKDDGGHGMGDLDDFAPRHEWILKLSNGDRPIQTDKRKPNVIRHQDARFTADEKHHSTQKPIGLIKELLQASTQEGEVVFDPFGGVYTTARATIPMSRKCVSTEMDTDYHATGREAVKQDIDREDDGDTLIYETEVA